MQTDRTLTGGATKAMIIEQGTPQADNAPRAGVRPFAPTNSFCMMQGMQA
jgi:hypothetical protein